MNGEIVNLNVKLLTIALTLLNTVVLFWIMKKLLFKPVNDFMTNRKERILADIQNAKNLSIEADSRLEEYTNKLSSIKEEKNKIISEGRIKGEALFNRIKEEAEKEKLRLMQNAENEKNLMMKNAREELKKEVAVLSMNIAEQIVKKEIDEALHKKLIDEAIEDISSIKA